MEDFTRHLPPPGYRQAGRPEDVTDRELLAALAIMAGGLLLLVGIGLGVGFWLWH